MQGQPIEQLSLILSGLVTIKTHAHGDTVDLARLSRGHFVGEMATLDPRPASANARTAEETRVWQISCSDFWEFLEGDHEIGFTIMKALAKELVGRIRMDTERSLREADRRHTDSYRADY